MTQYLIDTQPKLVTCTRCGAYVFACQVGGLKVAVDPRPLGVEEYRDALISGKGTYDQLDQAGRPHRLHRRTVSSTWPPYEGRKVLADHACGTRSMNVTAVETTELPPCSARANDMDARALDAMSTVASPVTPHCSDAPSLCDTCAFPVGPDEQYVGVQQGELWVWLMHDYDCRN